jgi:hypothetical protein
MLTKSGGFTTLQFSDATPSVRPSEGFIPDGSGKSGRVVKTSTGARHFKPKSFGCKRFASEKSEALARVKARAVTVESKAALRLLAADAVKEYEAKRGAILPLEPGKAWRK